jgi:hypothetical protein
MTTLGPSTTPGTYEFQVLDQLHDPNADKWSIPQIDGYINEARKKIVMDTGCLRTLQTAYFTAGIEQYFYGQASGGIIVAGGSGYTAPTLSFSGGGGSGVAATLGVSGGAVNTISFSSFGSGYSSAPTATISDATGTGASVAIGVVNINTYDVLNISPLWGTERYALKWSPFRNFSAWWRPFLASSYQRQPAAWAKYGDNSFFIAPPPDQSYPVEIDSVILPTPYVTGDTTTVDVIPVVNQDPIKFYAAYLAKHNAQNYGEAETKLNEYTRTMRECVSVYVGRLPDPYEDPD